MAPSWLKSAAGVLVEPDAEELEDVGDGDAAAEVEVRGAAGGWVAGCRGGYLAWNVPVHAA